MASPLDARSLNAMAQAYPQRAARAAEQKLKADTDACYARVWNKMDELVREVAEKGYDRLNLSFSCESRAAGLATAQRLRTADWSSRFPGCRVEILAQEINYVYPFWVNVKWGFNKDNEQTLYNDSTK